jgi:hypothetical protein
MKCPHCLVSIHESFTTTGIATLQAMTRPDGTAIPIRSIQSLHQVCPECKEIIAKVQISTSGIGTKIFEACPKGVTRPVPVEVPDPYRADFLEASLVLRDSAKASAAISRRCLQAVLRDKAQTKSKDLFDQIEEVSAPGVLPSHIVEDLHAVRSIGNIAAHTMKSTNTGEIIDVAPGEAEWNLDVLESLFDFYFVQPAFSTKRKAELNKKLKEAGKPEIK